MRTLRWWVVAVVVCHLVTGCAGLSKGKLSRSQTKSDTEAERRRIISDYENVAYIKFRADSPNITNPSTQPDQITIFSGTPSDKYVEIGALSIQAKDGYEYLTKVLKFKASTIGADAIMNFEMAEVPVKSTGSGSVSTDGAIFQTSKIRYQKKVSGVAIRFIQPH